jgi:hypothetical protein
MIWWYPLGAQTQTVISPLERVIFDKAKREALFNHLQVSHGQAGSFWKIYEEYEGDRRQLLKERLKLIKKYGEVHATATADKKARRLIGRLLINDVDQSQMYKEYYSRAAPIVGTQKALQFIHVEQDFQLRLNARLDSIMTHQDDPIASKGGRMY